jgi:hypothetical protein
MAVCGPSLFGTGNSNYIKVGNGEFVAVENVNLIERQRVSDLRMPYKQLLRGRVILKAGQANYLLNHLGLGDNATYLSIKATYDPKSVIELDNYINYAYYNYPVQNFSFAQLLVLTGNSTNRIPQIYLTNPNSKYPVFLDVLVGIIDDNYSFFNDDLNQNATSFTGLEYTDIKSFVVGESIVIYDKNTPKRALIYFGLPYINSISLNGSFLIIDDESFGTVFLNFIDEYNAVQAHSLINYVLEHPNVNIDDIMPSADTTPPVIHFNQRIGSTGSYIVNYTGLTAGAPYSTNNGFTFSTSISLIESGSSSVLYKDKLKDLLIDYIDDDRDGLMDIMDSELLILSSTSSSLNSINSVGTYSIKFNFEDLAHNDLHNVILNLNITI